MADNPATEKRLLSTMELSAVTESPDFLVRSRVEVQRVLADLLRQRTPVSVNFIGVDEAVASTLLGMDESAGALMFECPPEWRMHIEAPGGKSVMLVCVYDDSKIQFQGGCGVLAEFDGRPVARIAMPTFIWRFQRRRDPRYRTPPAPVLKVTLNLGFLESEAELVDLSMSGIGVINCDVDVNLDKDEILKDCSIVVPGVGRIAADLQVMHQTAVRMTDGASMNRVGCHLTRLGDESRQLIAHYVGALAEVRF